MLLQVDVTAKCSENICCGVRQGRLINIVDAAVSMLQQYALRTSVVVEDKGHLISTVDAALCQCYSIMF